jgi:hypothetical protein
MRSREEASGRTTWRVGGRKMRMRRSRLNLEFVFHSSGVFRVRIKGFFSESYKIVPVNKYYRGRTGPIGWACNEDGGEYPFPCHAHPGIRKLVITRYGAISEHMK